MEGMVVGTVELRRKSLPLQHHCAEIFSLVVHGAYQHKGIARRLVNGCRDSAVSMGAELVYQARTVVMVANGARKTGPVIESILGEITPDVPISYGQKSAAGEGRVIYVLDEAAAREVLEQRSAVEAKGCEIIDVRGRPYEPVESLTFFRDPDSGLLG